MTRIEEERATIIDLLKKPGNRPRVHGNGFIQLDLNPTMRLHVWGHSRIPRQKVQTQIHDHTFGFTSYILFGALSNISYEVVSSDDMVREIGDTYPKPRMLCQPYVATVRHGDDTVLTPHGERVWLRSYKTARYDRGQTYSMKPGEIHESRPHGLTVSVIAKDGPTLAQGGSSPLVYAEPGVVPDNSFDRYATPADVLWEIIGETIGLMLGLDR